jgi:hypothetical protein
MASLRGSSLLITTAMERASRGPERSASARIDGSGGFCLARANSSPLQRRIPTRVQPRLGALFIPATGVTEPGELATSNFDHRRQDRQGSVVKREWEEGGDFNLPS